MTGGVVRYGAVSCLTPLPPVAPSRVRAIAHNPAKLFASSSNYGTKSIRYITVAFEDIRPV